jgi:hypothetical protein
MADADESIRPLYCVAGDNDEDCACGATAAGNDPVSGVCQAQRSGPDPRIDPYGVRIVLTDRRARP